MTDRGGKKMKHLIRYFKMLCDEEYRDAENIIIGENVSFFVVAVLCLFMVLTEIGRSILYILAIFCCIIFGFAFLIISASEVIRIIKKFQREKEKWDIEEEFEGVEKDISEKKLMFYLDFSALEYYSKDFYANFLTDSFSFSCITMESNAVLVTDKNTLDYIKMIEGTDENKNIFKGYSTFIKNKFELIDIQDNETLSTTICEMKDDANIIVVTRDENMAKEMEKDNIQVMLIA